MFTKEELMKEYGDMNEQIDLFISDHRRYRLGENWDMISRGHHDVWVETDATLGIPEDLDDLLDMPGKRATVVEKSYEEDEDGKEILCLLAYPATLAP